MRVGLHEVAAQDARLQLESLRRHLLREAAEVAHSVRDPLGSDERPEPVA